MSESASLPRTSGRLPTVVGIAAALSVLGPALVVASSLLPFELMPPWPLSFAVFLVPFSLPLGLWVAAKRVAPSWVGWIGAFGGTAVLTYALSIAWMLYPSDISSASPIPLRLTIALALALAWLGLVSGMIAHWAVSLRRASVIIAWLSVVWLAFSSVLDLVFTQK